MKNKNPIDKIKVKKARQQFCCCMIDSKTLDTVFFPDPKLNKKSIASCKERAETLRKTRRVRIEPIIITVIGDMEDAEAIKSSQVDE